ncbi:MAG TPA: TonB family protein [Pyrinomonadaceae bacterium]|jgi:TonB family protein
MRRRLPNCLALVALAAVAAGAQQFTHTWLRLAPEGEEFAVHVPEPNFRIRRELPFAGGVTLRPASFEVTYRGGLFSVLSFSKSAAGTPAALPAFLEGFRRALGRAGVQAARQPGREVKLEGRAGVEFDFSAGDKTGKARVFETDTHFYAVMTLGGAESASAAEHFQSSFTFVREGADRVQVSDPAEVLTSAVKAPEPLWPVAYSRRSVGIIVGDRDIAAPNSISTDGPPSGGPPSDIRGKAVVSGGVLNGKAVVKPAPVYPAIAKAARAQGAVVVQIIVDEEGYVIFASAVSGHPLLQQASVFAARQARFSPTLLEGQPVKVSGVITYNFVLQ